MKKEGDLIRKKRKEYEPRNVGKRKRADERNDFLEEWLADICSDTETDRGSDIELREDCEEQEEVDRPFDFDELLLEDQTTERDGDDEAEWSDDPLDCGMRSDSTSDSDTCDMQ